MAIRLSKTEMCEEDYEPPFDTRRRFWRHTKKQPYLCGGIEAPGLIDYNDARKPLVWFLVAIVLEIWGLVLLAKAGMYWHNALLLGLFDLLLAIGMHLPLGKIHEFKVLHFIAEAGHRQDMPSAPPPGVTETLESRIKSLMISRGVCILLIISLGLFKALSYFAFVGELGPFVIAAIISFLAVAMLHVWWTGSFIFWLCAEIADWMQHNSYVNAVVNSNMVSAERDAAPLHGAQLGAHVFELPRGDFEWRIIDRHVVIAYDLLDILRDRLQIYERPWTCGGDLYSILSDMCPMDGPRSDALPQKPEPGPSKYVLLTWGILSDRQVKRLYETPLPAGSEGVIVEAITHQAVNIMGIELPWYSASDTAAAADAGE